MVLLWWWADNWGIPKLAKIPTADLLLAIGLVGLGQVRIWFCAAWLCFQLHMCISDSANALSLQTLNISMYNAIGKKGVYYGEKLGSKVPWCTSFPFSVVSHPQYVGSVLSVWGMFALVQAQGPSTLWVIATYWSALYVVTGLIEHFA